MQFLSVIEEDPVIGWFAALAVMLVIVPLLSWVWGRLSGPRPEVKKAVTVADTKPVRFNSGTDLLVIFLGAMVLLFVFFWLR